MKIVVLGGGESGCGAAYLAKKKGLEVFLSDKGAIKDTYKNFLIENQIEFEEENPVFPYISDINDIETEAGDIVRNISVNIRFYEGWDE